jgi:hypothetical protein
MTQLLMNVKCYSAKNNRYQMHLAALRMPLLCASTDFGEVHPTMTYTVARGKPHYDSK